MQSSTKNIARVLVVAFAAAMVGAAVAQESSKRAAAYPAPHAVQAQAEPSGEPQRTTATYADWVFQCVSNAGQTPSNACDIAQVTAVRGKNVPFSRVAVFYPGRGQPSKLTVQVPANASFATQVHIQTADSDPGIVAPFSRCLPTGCFADFELKDDVLKKFLAARGAGKLSFTDAAGRNITIPLSFNGFSEAFAALAKEQRQPAR